MKSFILSFNKTFNVIKASIPFLGLVLVFVSFRVIKLPEVRLFLKFYPVCMNFAAFSVFFLSLFQKETIIQKIAKSTVDNITDIELKYTKNLTFVWAGFCFINFLISFLTVFGSEKFWYIYNGCISYILIGMLFSAEYIFRIGFKKRHGI